VVLLIDKPSEFLQFIYLHRHLVECRLHGVLCGRAAEGSQGLRGGLQGAVECSPLSLK
jgi:hypothetical protein